MKKIALIATSFLLLSQGAVSAAPDPVYAEMKKNLCNHKEMSEEVWLLCIKMRGYVDYRINVVLEKMLRENNR